MKYGNVTLGQAEAAFNKLKNAVGEDWLSLLLSDELAITRKERKFREVESLEIRIPAIPKMTAKQILEKYPFLRSVLKDDSPESEVVLTLTTVLEKDEDRISGNDYKVRLKSVRGQLGLSQVVWLVEHQDEFPEFMALPPKICIDFPGTIAVDVQDLQDIPYLYQNNGRWLPRWYWLGRNLDSDCRIAVSLPPQAGKAA